MAGLSVQADNAAFFEAEQKLPTPEQQGFTQGREGQLVTDDKTIPQNAPEGNQQGQEAPQEGDPFQEVEKQVQVQQDEGLLSEIDKELGVEETDTEVKPEPEKPSDEEFEAFANNFEKYTGVKFKEALDNYQQQQTIVQKASEQLRTTYTQLALMQQKLDLQSMWAADPEVQQQVQQGQPISAVVDARITALRDVYNSLDEKRRRVIDSKGAEGVAKLWQIYQRSNQARTVPGSVGTPTGGARNNDLKKLSEIMAMPESQYKREGLQLLKNKQFIDDLG